MKRKDAQPNSIAPPSHRGSRARAQGHTLETCTIGALPIVNRLLQRMQIEQIMNRHLPRDSRAMKIPTFRCLLLSLRNILISREPVYGLGEWAERFAPELLGLSADELQHVNDDRVGRCLDRFFKADLPPLILDVVRHVIKEFDLSLDELHNDSTSISFFGAYEDASEEQQRGNKTRLAITHGHSKDRRPDLKQLLYILSITDDGGVPLYYTAASGNVADDTTHRDTWDLLRELVGRPDFLYVADCKLASQENLQYIHNRNGRFITILPRTRREDAEFRQMLFSDPTSVEWDPVYDLMDDQGNCLDAFRVRKSSTVSSEGFRLLWFHSTRKAARDGRTRARRINRLANELAKLRNRLASPKTRFRKRAKVEQAVNEILSDGDAHKWFTIGIEETEQETFKQSTPGRPGKDTHYTRNTQTRYQLSWSINATQFEEDKAADGVFPLITNQQDMPAEEVLRAYKRQPLIEKRFSQFKSDFEVAPIYLKETSRIQSLLCIYFFVLVVQTLLERELRQALADSEYDGIPLYPEQRTCQAPTTRRVLDVFDNIQRHRLTGDDEDVTFVTQLSPLQAQIARWFGIDPKKYGR